MILLRIGIIGEPLEYSIEPRIPQAMEFVQCTYLVGSEKIVHVTRYYIACIAWAGILGGGVFGPVSWDIKISQWLIIWTKGWINLD